jgi:hypothetical protein
VAERFKSVKGFSPEENIAVCLQEILENTSNSCAWSNPDMNPQRVVLCAKNDRYVQWTI